ncbi:alpha/beta hydrolase family esterase [Sphingobacterium suaedae]|uniref:Alpha/beta hydrolase family esterase n=1 Tax=Sphingobacterium suaedae TaxID=1686402 RepID=A0ABW5KN45_9SPHI
MMRKISVFLLLVIMSLVTVAQTAYFTHQGLKRKYIVYTPKGYHQTKRYPVVFNFHDKGMTPAEQMLYTKLNQTADKYGFIVVYPKGVNEDWNVGFGMSYRHGIDDIGFIDALLSHLQKDYLINPSKVFATGLSRGGFFCHRLAAELSHRFAAVAPVGANLPDSVAMYHQGINNMAMLMINGMVDEIVDYAGKEGSYYSAMGSYTYWKDRSFTNEMGRPADTVFRKGEAVLVREASNSRISISLLTIEDSGHTWAGADDFNIGLPLGKTSREIDLNEYIWAFFERHASKTLTTSIED